MTYVVSDIHGCDKLYFRLLERCVSVTLIRCTFWVT